MRQTRSELQTTQAKLALCEAVSAGMKEEIGKQNESIAEHKRLSEERLAEIDRLLSLPPRVIYRDKIREIPIIETGPCEEVVTALADYFEEVTNEND